MDKSPQLYWIANLPNVNNGFVCAWRDREIEILARIIEIENEGLEGFKPLKHAPITVTAKDIKDAILDSWYSVLKRTRDLAEPHAQAVGYTKEDIVKAKGL